MDWLRNLQIRFILKKNSNVLDISDPRLVSNNEKIMIFEWILFVVNLDIKSIIARIIL